MFLHLDQPRSTSTLVRSGPRDHLKPPASARNRNERSLNTKGRRACTHRGQVDNPEDCRSCHPDSLGCLCEGARSLFSDPPIAPAKARCCQASRDPPTAITRSAYSRLAFDQVATTLAAFSPAFMMGLMASAPVPQQRAYHLGSNQ